MALKPEPFGRVLKPDDDRHLRIGLVQGMDRLPSMPGMKMSQMTMSNLPSSTATTPARPVFVVTVSSYQLCHMKIVAAYYSSAGAGLDAVGVDVEAGP